MVLPLSPSAIATTGPCGWGLAVALAGGEERQHHFRLAPHGSSKVACQFRAGSERSGGLRLLSPQRQHFLRPGRFRFINSLNILLNELPSASTPDSSFLLSASISPTSFLPIKPASGLKQSNESGHEVLSKNFKQPWPCTIR